VEQTQQMEAMVVAMVWIGGGGEDGRHGDGNDDEQRAERDDDHDADDTTCQCGTRARQARPWPILRQHFAWSQIHGADALWRRQRWRCARGHAAGEGGQRHNYWWR
jgi:hypothetical protein